MTNTNKRAKHYAEYKEIKAKAARENRQQVAELVATIRTDWANFQNTWRYRELLTERQKTKTKAEQVKILIAKIKKEYSRNLEKFFTECDQIAAAEPITYLYISVDWVRSSVWGMNPHAEIRANDGTFSGSASGCGYDKLSAATAEAFNKSHSVKQLIFDKYEQALRKNKAAALRDVVGYGSGYKKPYFEGGVGFSCHDSIFRNCGATVHEWREGKSWDCMTYQWSN